MQPSCKKLVARTFILLLTYGYCLPAGTGLQPVPNVLKIQKTLQLQETKRNGLQIRSRRRKNIVLSTFMNKKGYSIDKLRKAKN